MSLPFVESIFALNVVAVKVSAQNLFAGSCFAVMFIALGTFPRLWVTVVSVSPAEIVTEPVVLAFGSSTVVWFIVSGVTLD